MLDTMLIVDDYEMERAMLRDLLQGSFEIIEAANGREALETMEVCRGHIDVVLLDLMMPEVDGFEVLEKRQELDYFKDVPVVVLTSSGNVSDQVRAFNLGANDFISKPIIPEIAISRVKNALSARQRYKSILKESEEYKVRSEIDLMTGLYNKTTCERIIEKRLQENSDQQHCLMILDIDNFKAVNDHEGHQVGDNTIKIIANMISMYFRRSDIVGRIGGDEFVVLMSGIPSKEVARQKAHEIICTMKHKPNLSIPANVSVSLGMVFTDNQYVDYASLFQKADEALYSSKKMGKARLTEYGLIPDENEGDAAKCIIALTNDRSVWSGIETAVPQEMRFINAETVNDFLDEVKKNEYNLAMVYIDVSDGKDVWNRLYNVGALKRVPVIAVCREGDMQQYKKALLTDNVDDVITTPIDIEFLRRRTHYNLEQGKCR